MVFFFFFKYTIYKGEVKVYVPCMMYHIAFASIFIWNGINVIDLHLHGLLARLHLMIMVGSIFESSFIRFKKKKKTHHITHLLYWWDIYEIYPKKKNHDFYHTTWLILNRDGWLISMKRASKILLDCWEIIFSLNRIQALPYTDRFKTSDFISI